MGIIGIFAHGVLYKNLLKLLGKKRYFMKRNLSHLHFAYFPSPDCASQQLAAAASSAEEQDTEASTTERSGSCFRGLSEGYQRDLCGAVPGAVKGRVS